MLPADVKRLAADGARRTQDCYALRVGPFVGLALFTNILEGFLKSKRRNAIMPPKNGESERSGGRHVLA